MAGGSLDPEKDLGAKLFSHLLADLTRGGAAGNQGCGADADEV